MSTSGQLRTRIQPELASDSSSGVGRNFLIQRYLGAGDYQLKVAPNRDSAGPAGLRVEPTPVADAGRAPVGARVRTTLEPGGAVRVSVPIEQAGRYRIQAEGLKRDFAIQLTGPDGWPVIAPGQSAPVTAKLRPGEHTLTVLPQSVRARAVVGVDAVDTERAERSGHGPHSIALNRRVDHTWREPAAEDAERKPDRWRFELPAAMRVEVALDDAMVAQLRQRTQSGWQAQGRIVGARDRQARKLEAGEYELAVRARFPDDRRDYHVGVHPDALPLGQRRSVSLPARIPLVVGEARLVRLASRGDVDVAATLENAAGEQVAASDDRPDDWNFLISRRLQPGRYTLHVAAAQIRAGASRGRCPARPPVGVRHARRR